MVALNAAAPNSSDTIVGSSPAIRIAPVVTFSDTPASSNPEPTDRDGDTPVRQAGEHTGDHASRPTDDTAPNARAAQT